MAVKSISRRMSDSVLMIARLTSLPCVMDVRRRFSICLSLEKNARRYSWWPLKLRTFLARSQVRNIAKSVLHTLSLYKSACTEIARYWFFLAHRLWIYQQSDSSRQQMNCRDHLGTNQRVSWQLSAALSGIMLTGNQSSQTDQPAAYKLVGVGLEKQWTGQWNWRVASQADACLTHACIGVRTRSQFRRQLSWARKVRLRYNGHIP